MSYTRNEPRQNGIDPTVEMILRLYEREKLYGTLEIKFEAGRVVLLKKQETIKPPTHRDNRTVGDTSM